MANTTTTTTPTTYSCPQVNGVFDPMLCASCERLGKKCYGPRAIDLPAKQLLDFCRRRREYLGWTYNKTADEAKVARGTVTRLFTGEAEDFKHETIRPIYHALTGVDMNSFVRPMDGPAIEELQAENEKLKAELEKAIAEKDAIAEKVRAEVRAENREHIEDLRRYNQNKLKAIIVLAILLLASLLVIITALIIDRRDPSRGYFWMESDVQYFDSQRVEERSSDADADEFVTIAYDGQKVRLLDD